MATRPLTADLAAASSKLADRERPARHGTHFSLKVTAKDGKPATVTWLIDTHRKEAMPYVLKELALCLRLAGPAEVQEALGTWNRERPIAHLEQFTQHELKPPALRLR